MEGEHAQDLGPHCVDPFYLDHCDFPVLQASQNHLRLLKRGGLLPKMFACPQHVGDFTRDCTRTHQLLSVCIIDIHLVPEILFLRYNQSHREEVGVRDWGPDDLRNWLCRGRCQSCYFVQTLSFQSWDVIELRAVELHNRATGCQVLEVR